MSWWLGWTRLETCHDALKRRLRKNVIKTIKQLFGGKELAVCLWCCGNWCVWLSVLTQYKEIILGQDWYVVAFELNQIAGMRSPATREKYILAFIDWLVKQGCYLMQQVHCWELLHKAASEEAFLVMCHELYVTKWRHDWMVERIWPPASQPPCHDSSPQFIEARYTGKSQGTEGSWSKEGLEDLKHWWLMCSATVKKSIDQNSTLTSWRKRNSGTMLLVLTLQVDNLQKTVR